jgi:deoxyribose-phosphate aldolase
MSRKASMACMMAGADFIKTSTGKEPSTPRCLRADHGAHDPRLWREMTGFKIGFKPAGGIAPPRTR